MALQLARSSGKELVVGNALLTLAKACARDAGVAQRCLELAGALAAQPARAQPHLGMLVRLLGCCTCHGLSAGACEAQVCGFLLQGVGHEQAKVRHFAVLGLGNLCCDSAGARKVVAESPYLSTILSLEPRDDNVLGLLGNLSVDLASEELGMAVLDHAALNAHAAFALSNCVRHRCVKVRKELVDAMLQSADQSVQESGLDIIMLSSASSVGPRPALCWMTEHVNADVRRKARKQVERFVEADLLALVERGCVPVLWQLSLATAKRASAKDKEADRFAEAALASLRKRLTPTVHQLLLRTLSMEGNEELRGHVATAMVHLAPEVLLGDADAIASVVALLDSPEGRAPAMDFFQAVHAHMVLRYEAPPAQRAGSDEDERKEAALEDIEDNISPEELCKVLLEGKPGVRSRRRDQAFSLLLDRFDHVYTAKHKRSVHKALVAVCGHALLIK